jgi:N-acetylmuramoyl-L-alanine amidase
MIKILDKFVPTICVFLALLFLSTALYLKADTTFQNTNTKPEQEEIKAKHKILIVAGHDFEHSGAFTDEIKESELTLRTASYLRDFLEKDPAFEVYMTREKLDGNLSTENKNDYTQAFQKYFSENREAVLEYRDSRKREIEQKNNQDQVQLIDQVEHNNAPEEMSYRLYAINKWIEDNKVDIVIHLHFNDYPARKKAKGKYEGFSIYVSDQSLRNAESSQRLAKSVGDSLDDIFKYSNLPIESDGIISTYSLIATGANDTIQAAAILIEYGYIYEDKFQDEEVLKKAAEQTYLGIKNYFVKPF